MNFERLLAAIAGIAGYFRIQPGNDRKAESAPGRAARDRREDFVYQESS